MIRAEDRLFPDGIPRLISMAAFSKLLGVSRTQACKIARSRPDMLVNVPGMKFPRVRSELYQEIIGK